MGLSQEQQIEYDALVDEFVSKGGPTEGQIKACGKDAPDKVARLKELGWIAPESKDGGIAGEETTRNDVVKSCIGCAKEAECHPDGVKFDSREMAKSCTEWEEDEATSAPVSITEIIQQAIGEASMCWENPDGAGVYNSDAAIKVANKLKDDINNFLDEIEEDAMEEAGLSNVVHIENRRKKRNTFLADSVRDQSDRDFINTELGVTRGSGLKRKYKGKIKKVTTIKHYELIDGDFVTEFIIDLK